MSSYIGIDLGTTNSAICSYDGESLQIYKSPEQNDVTPSALFFDRRGNKFVGFRAYANAARNPDNAATLFKRLIGTGTKLTLSAVGKTLTPEECSSEILRVLFGYLPDAIRSDAQLGTVITVPAAFNQMQKDATLSAAEMASIGRVALMQEPVAAIMAVMHKRKTDGNFLVYDFGGGTLDIAVAESTAGRVSLLAHGGIAMCGGRDFDLAIFSEVIAPWLLEHFELPEGFETSEKYKSLVRMSTWAAERAKIALSSEDETSISLSESELSARDGHGDEIYLDIPLSRSTMNALIEEKLSDSLVAARETLNKAGLAGDAIERIVFVGGPTQYKPLRDRIAQGLGIAGTTDVNPMTAVAEGAAIFAESIDWSSQLRGRKSARGALTVKSAISVSLAFLARTSASRTKIALRVASPAEGCEFQLDSLDTGWSSGRTALIDGASVEVPLAKAGENTFKIFLFDAKGASVVFDPSKLLITRTAATIDAIPSSSSLAFEVQDRASRQATLEFIVRGGEPLPKKSSVKFQATTALRAGGDGVLRFKLWEGEITDPVSDNRFIGELVLSGQDLEPGAVIPAGAELLCEYEVADSGNVTFNVSVPAISATFSSARSLYSRRAAELDYAHAGQRVQTDAGALRKRVAEVAERIKDDRLAKIEGRLGEVEQIAPTEADPERAKAAMDRLLEAKKLLAQVRRDRLKEMRQLDLDSCGKFFNDIVRKYARPTEIISFEALTATAQRAVARIDTGEFEEKLAQLRGRNFDILWREDWFVIDRFKRRSGEAHLFADQPEFEALIERGMQAITTDKMDELRTIVYMLDILRIGGGAEEDVIAPTNLVKL